MLKFTDFYRRLEDRISDAISRADPAAFDELALDTYRFQREFNAPYDAYSRQLGAPSTPATWREIPAVPQGAFKVSALRTFPAQSALAEFHTSGTTGEGRGVHQFCSLRLYDEAILRGWDLLNLPLLPQLILIQPPAQAPHSSLSYMMARLALRAPAGEQHWCLRPDGGLDLAGIDAVLARHRALGRPVMVLGTALAFLHWCEQAPPAQPLPPGSVVFETGGYKGSRRALSQGELYGLLDRHLRPSLIVNEYGMTELSSQCYALGLGEIHRAPPWMRVLVVDPATNHEVSPGQTGVLRIYDLANLGSVIGIQTRDLAVRREGGFELLGRDPAALPRGCSRSADEMLGAASP